MQFHQTAFVSLASCIAIATVAHTSRAQDGMPREDVIHEPAIADGLWLHPLFQSNMVLQRDKPIRIWGWATPGKTITVTFASQEQITTAAQDRAWSVTFPALPASSEPRDMVVTSDGVSQTLENILLGDVWLLGGQSNMEFEIAKLDNGDLEMASANFDQIRLLTIPYAQGPEPVTSFPKLHEWSAWFNRHFRKGYWDVCTPETVRDFSGIGYVFARRVHMAAQVPIGVIDLSRGGTALETWVPAAVLAGIDTPEVQAMLADWDQRVSEFDPQADLQQRVARHRERVEAGRVAADAPEPSDLNAGPALDMNRPGNCYAGMIAPVAGLPVKGAIFHHGFNNAIGESTRKGEMYFQVMTPMITAWREAFNDATMPFGIISLCTAGEPQTRDTSLDGLADDGCFIREAQYKTFMTLRESGDQQIGYASSFDQRRSWFHPQIKIPVGERIARWALATQYGMSDRIRWLPPMIRQTTMEDGRIVLQFDQPVGPYHNGPIEGFIIAGADKKFYPAEATHLKLERGEDQRVVVLSSPFVPQPVAFRHAWHRNPNANLKSMNHTDLPVSIQRSDDWTSHELYEAYVGKLLASPNTMNRNERRQFQDALRNAETQRRLKEAEAYIEAHRDPPSH